MSLRNLSEDEYYNKVYGCWVGKNCGGTLGVPLEEGWGKKEMFDVWWYPELKEEGISNDDLELQLIWLQALEDKGIHIKARDLAEYWIDCIQYNPDEYGLHKTNLKKGLLPPVSSYYRNWFKHCMGNPVRSEIWACIAPGLPNVAASYAYEDGIVDHAGGESVYGEMFNAAMESAAFLISDKKKLLEVGLSFIPEKSRTAKAIKDAIKAHKEGMDWKEARNFVLQNSYSPIAQYSPINLGFQTIGFLYGKDFGDAICKAVNCGYDTDCTGATLGALLGIILGRDGLPDKWTKPLGDKIATSSSWGGIANVREIKDLAEFTKRVCRIGKKILFLYGEENATGGEPVSEKMNLSFQPDENTKRLWNLSPTKVDFDLRTLLVSVDYLGDPVVELGTSKEFEITLRNSRLVALDIEVFVRTPEGWEVEPGTKKITIEPGAEYKYNLLIKVDDIKLLNPSNRMSLCVSVKGRPQLEEVPLVFIGANRWLISQVFREKIEASSLESSPAPAGLDENWTTINFPGDELKLEEKFQREPGILYLRHYIHSPSSRDVRVGLPSNCPFKMWLNGDVIHEVKHEGRWRPSYAGGDSKGPGRTHVNTNLKKGWNQFFIKVIRKDKPVQAYFVICDASFCHGFFDLMECKFPWEI